MKIRLDQERMKVELEANFSPLMQSRYEFPGLSLDIQGQLMGAKRSKFDKNRFQEGFLTLICRVYFVSPRLTAPESPRMDFHCRVISRSL